MSRDPRASVSIDSDIRTYTIRDPRANSSNVAATPPQIPSQTVQQPRPQIAQQLPKPGSSTDTEKVIIILIAIIKILRRIKYLNQFMLYFRLL